MSALDGFVTAAVTGPRFADPQDWMCPLMGLPRDVLPITPCLPASPGSKTGSTRRSSTSAVDANGHALDALCKAEETVKLR